MKCPKCGYHSFEHLDNCKKCGQDLTAHKAKYKLRGYTTAATTAAAPATGTAESAVTTDSADNESIDFGFDFLAEDEQLNGAGRSGVSLGGKDNAISLDQPFDVDSETLPGDPPAGGKNKAAKGAEFAF